MKIRIALIQQSASDNRQQNLEKGVAAFRKAAQEKAQLVVYSELAFSPFFPQFPGGPVKTMHGEPVPGPTTDLFCGLAKEHGVVTVLNLFERDDDRTFDSSPVINADGSLLGVVRMVHIMDGPGFHERDYYHPGDQGAPVFSTHVGRLGVAICYDRHYPEYMRALGIKGAQIVVIPQAGTVDEWPPGLFEAELQVASLQNGYFCALANRIGKEERLTFAGESFVTDPMGQVIARAGKAKEQILITDLDLALINDCPAHKHFLPDRRPDQYPFK